MSGGEVVCSGWLRKSPPEKKLKRYVSAPFPSRLSRSPRPAGLRRAVPPAGPGRCALRPAASRRLPGPAFLFFLLLSLFFFFPDLSASFRSPFRESREREGGGVFPLFPLDPSSV